MSSGIHVPRKLQILRNFKIALRKLQILRLRRQFKIA